MRIDVRMTTKYDSPALRRFAEHAVTQRLGARAHHISSVGIRLKDINGPRGGIDKVCIVTVAVNGATEVVTRGESVTWDDAVLIAVWSARTALDRRLDKKKRPRTRERLGGRNLDWDVVESRRETA